MENLHQVVQEIETTGETSVPPLNNIKQHYKVIKDPSNDFCKEAKIVLIFKSVCPPHVFLITFLCAKFPANDFTRKII
jgi:hypothetical protein